MKTISKKGEGQYWDQETDKLLGEDQLLELIKNDVSFCIVRADNDTDITDAELAQLLIRRTKRKTEGERIMDSVKNFFESGHTSATQALQDLAFFGYGVLATTEKKSRELIDQLITSGKVSKERGEELFKKAKENLQEQERQFEKKAKETVAKHLKDLGISTPEDLEKKIHKSVVDSAETLNQELQDLKKKLEKVSQKLDKMASK